MTKKFPSLIAIVLATAVAAPVLAVTVDDFSTAHGALGLSVPPDAVGDSTRSTVSGAGILGTERELELTLLADPSSTGVSVEGTGAVLRLVAGAGARGQAVVTWDGVGSGGLGGVDLTAGNHTGLRIAVNAATAAGAELMLEVFSAGGVDSSRAALVLGAVAAPQDVVLSFNNDFVTHLGGGADFTDVDAITLTVRAAALTVDIDLAETVGPTLQATKTAALLVDNDGDGVADPGDTLRFSVTVTSDGAEATSTQLDDTVDPNLTAVADSLFTTPIAFRDTYEAFANIQVAVPAPGVLDNDHDPDGESFTVSAYSATSAQGGTVVVDPDGAVTYDPPAGFTGVDSFTYTVTDDGGRTGAGTASVIIDTVAWFVRNDHAGPYQGTLINPFNVLADAETASAPGEVIFVFEGDGTITGHSAGITLKDGQELVGEGAGLSLGGQVIVPPGNRPVIGNTSGDGVFLATNNTIRGLDIVDTAGGFGINGIDPAWVTVADVSISGSGGGVSVVSTGVPLEIVSLSLDSVASTGSPSTGLIFNGLDSASSVVIGGTTITSPANAGIGVFNAGGATFSFGATSISNGGSGVELDANSGASLSFGSLTVTTLGGVGLRAQNSGTVAISGASNSIAATGGAGVDVFNTSLGAGWTFASVSSSTSPFSGISLQNVTGAFTANGGTISGATADAFVVNGGGDAITYAGAITSASNNSVDVSGRTGGTVSLTGAITDTGQGINLVSNGIGTVTLAGDLDLDTTTNQAFTATGGGTVNVTGANSTIDTTTGTGVRIENATIGASGVTFQSVSVNGAANGIVLTSTGGGAFEVTGDGASDPANTTRGRTTALQGGGTITLGSGGTLNNTTADAVSLTGAANVTLRNMVLSNSNAGSRDGVSAFNASDNLSLDNVRITGFSDNGVRGSGLTGFAMQHCEVESNAKSGDSITNDEANLRFDNLFGTADIDNSLIRDVNENNIRVSSCEAAACGGSLSLDLTFDNVAVQDTLPGSGGNVGILVRSFNDADVDLTVMNSEIIRNRSVGIQHNTNNAGTAGSTTITGSTINRSANAISVAHQGTTHSFLLDDNMINTVNGTPSNFGNAVNVFLGGLSSASSVLQGRIINNTVGNSATADSGSVNGIGIDLFASGAGTLTAFVDNNTVRAIRLDSAFRAISSNHTGTINVTVKNNTFDVTPGSFPLAGLDLAAGAVGTDTGTMCADITGNTRFQGDAVFAGAYITTASGTPTIELVGYGGADNDLAAIEAFLDAAATTVTPPATGSFTTFLNAGTVTGRGTACPLPP